MAYLPKTPLSEVWNDRPEYREGNNGAGICNTGAVAGKVCVLGGIGCNVDHSAINFYNIKTRLTALERHVDLP